MSTRRLRLGFAGNMNCLPFQYAFKLKQAGHDVLVIVESEPRDFLKRPEYFYPEITLPYPDWIIPIPLPASPTRQSFPAWFMRPFLRELNACDAVFLNDYAHALKPFLRPGLPAISICSGSDLDVLCRTDNTAERARSIGSRWWLRPFKAPLLARRTRLQREGIRQALVVNYFPEGINPVGDRLLEEIMRGRPYCRYQVRGVALDRFPYVPPPQHDRLVVFSGTRFLWKDPLPPGCNPDENKGNDFMIRGLAAFRRRYQGHLEIHFVEKGLHVEEAKALCQEVGLAPDVIWHREMPMSDLMQLYARSDICFDQVGRHWLGAVGIYAMATGRPLIANQRPDVFDRLTRDNPICHATNAEMVCDWMEKLAASRALREEIGRASRAYVLRYHSADNDVAFFMGKIEEALAGTQSRSSPCAAS
jgi:glycosyltransferase involved in cell wall biosynthesis